jgi:glutathione synthase/RimK-type ligase-like ATP-grasp enzyme
MSKKQYDYVLATQQDFLHPASPDWYVQQVLDEDSLLIKALELRGLTASRVAWDDPEYDWAQAKNVIIRATWNYSPQIKEYTTWLKTVSEVSHLINPLETVLWNLDKHYLFDLERNGISIPPSHIVQQGSTSSLLSIIDQLTWTEFVVKPAVSGGGRHTYRVHQKVASDFNSTFQELVKAETMILQEFQSNILTMGEITLVCFGGKYSHAIRKFAKDGEFRVQDDFGGRVEPYKPSQDEIDLAERAMKSIEPIPAYGRVDMMWDNHNNLCVSELELIEPELWLRFKQTASEMFVDALLLPIV